MNDHFCDTTERASQRLCFAHKGGFPCITEVGKTPLIPQPRPCGFPFGFPLNRPARVETAQAYKSSAAQVQTHPLGDGHQHAFPGVLGDQAAPADVIVGALLPYAATLGGPPHPLPQADNGFPGGFPLTERAWQKLGSAPSERAKVTPKSIHGNGSVFLRALLLGWLYEKAGQPLFGGGGFTILTQMGLCQNRGKSNICNSEFLWVPFEPT